MRLMFVVAVTSVHSSPADGSAIAHPAFTLLISSEDESEAYEYAFNSSAPAPDAELQLLALIGEALRERISQLRAVKFN